MPGGCWARVVDADTPEGVDRGLLIEVGSLSLESGEVKTLTHSFMGSKQGGLSLASVVFSKVEAIDDEGDEDEK